MNVDSLNNYDILIQTLWLMYSVVYAVFLGCGSALFAFVFINVLIKPDSVLDFFPEFVERTLKIKPCTQNAAWKLKIYYAWTTCSKCFGGQASILLYTIIVITQGVSILGYLFAFPIAILTAKYLESKFN